MFARLRPRPQPQALFTTLNRRTLVYIKDGSLHARGMKKDPSEYMTSSTGITYPGDSTTIKPIKDLLGQNYSIPDSLALQVLTHKSFAHGKKPFNERLANLGRQFLRVQTTEYAVSQKSSQPTAIAGNNFDIDTKALELMSSTAVLAQICKQIGINKSIFWKNPNTNQSPERSGENTVCAKTVDALVGAVLMYHGESKAAEFVRQHFLEGENSVLTLMNQLYKRN
ncbi:hypothetical protein TRICI_000947 [Trichomonascus ciferrii]|uniref:RNase III domain-containing protein n=1 Tax=Trichomonascus ciferrii TaxID=44093 RepID=A0A642VAF3_9ASCO|nr:hypothetical protein TRICI_000947 [Trichomonascus ciferrii]